MQKRSRVRLLRYMPSRFLALALNQCAAELVLGLTLSISRRITEQASLIKSGKVIISTDYVAVGLNKKTIGLVGMGDTAREVALKFRGAFGCRILVYSPTSPVTRCEPLRYDTSIHKADHGAGMEQDSVTIPHERVASLHEMLPQCDVVSLHAPVVPETVNMMSAKEFALMKPTAVFINTGRGQLGL